MSIELKLPLMGEGVIEATIATWLKAEGDTVKQFEPIVEVETDKVTTEIVAEHAGTLVKIMAAEGETVAVEQVLAVIEGDTLVTVSSTPAPSTAAVNGNGVTTPTLAPVAPAVGAPAPTAPSPTRYSGRVSPVVARMVKLHEINLDKVHGTGKNNRVTKRDVEAYLAHQTAPVAPVATPTAPRPPVQVAVQPAVSTATNASVVPHSTMRKRIAEHMVLSKATSPHATTVHEIDYSSVMAHRKAHKAEFAARGVKLTYMAYLAMAVVKGLQAVPHANSSWQDDGLLVHPAIHLGIAAAVDDGLVVPVVKNADTLNLLGMAQAIGDLANKARGKQLAATDMQGGTFTITNHGVFGSIFATPIINQPQAGILGIGVVEDRVCAIDGMVAIRPKAYASLSFDHRILDGAGADRFMQVVRETIEAWD